MQLAHFAAACCSVLVLAAEASAQDAAANRYQMVVLNKLPNSTIDSVVVLDNRTGHMWKWSESPAMGNLPHANVLVYLG